MYVYHMEPLKMMMQLVVQWIALVYQPPYHLPH